MFERAVESYRFINRSGTPEDSLEFRVAVLVTVLISLFAAVRYGSVGLPTGIGVTVGVLAGSFLSYRWRDRANLLIKLVLSVLLLVVFVLFCSELGGSVHDLRYPLVRLFLWLQVLHSFDLPTRRDLDFSLVSSAILVAFAGSLSTSNSFLYLIVPFFASALVALYLGHASAMRGSDVYVEGAGRSPHLRVVLTGLVLVPLTLAFFMVLPRLPGFNAYYLPVSKSGSMPSEFDALLKNPGYKDFPDKFPETPQPYNPNAYFGFNKFMDLRVRGVPADQTVMKVRSASPSYWRSTAFDKFLGNGWENTEKADELQSINSSSLPLNVSYPGESGRYGTRDLVQTFYIEGQLPNTVFGAYVPREVFFPTRVLKVDSMMTVLAPLELDPGLIYTVVSEVSDVSPEMLRRSRGGYPAGMRDRFCQLPEMSPKVAELARQVTAGAATDYDRVNAISEYLKSNYAYDLNVAKQGNAENTVEFFLFNAKRGFCEHFATAMAVMCRSINIPARVAVGFAPGEYNPLTGYYEVSGRDAHAWVEAYFPMFGWISFDPTPGWTDPSNLQRHNATWSGFTMLRGIGRALSHVFPASWARAVGSSARAAIRGMASAARAVTSAGARYWAWSLVLLVFLVTGALLLRRRRRRERTPRSPGSAAGPRERAYEVFTRMTVALERGGMPRAPWQTPLEYACEVDRRMGSGLAGKAAALFNNVRFARAPSGEDLAALERAAREVEDATSGSGHFDAF
jgi:protein-glutamine gamma-glutamyltransferase